MPPLVRGMPQARPHRCLRHRLSTAAAGGDSPAAAMQYCAQLTRKYEYGYAMCTMLLPRHLQTTQTVLRAVNIETARVADQVKGELQGRMRLLWWREAIEAATDDEIVGPAELPSRYRTPVVVALAGVWRQHRLAGHFLDRALLLRAVDARVDALDPEQPQEIYSLEKYAEETASCFLYLLLQSGGYAGQISAESNDLTTAQEAATCRAVSHIGTAMGLTILLQGAPHYASRRQCPLPASIMALHGVSVEDFYRALRREETPSDGCGEGATTVRGGTPGTADNGAAGLADVFYDVAGNAAVHLEHARRLRSEVPTQWRPLLLPAALADDYLKRLQAAHFDGFHPVLQAGLTSPFRLQCRLLRHWAQGYY